MKAGLLEVAAPQSHLVERCLPPEHKVIATREDPFLKGVLQLIIKGPMMPAWSDRSLEPEAVKLVLAVTPTVASIAERRSDHFAVEMGAALSGNWDIDGQCVGAWNIGEWPTFSDMLRELER